MRKKKEEKKGKKKTLQTCCMLLCSLYNSSSHFFWQRGKKDRPWRTNGHIRWRLSSAGKPVIFIIFKTTPAVFIVCKPVIFLCNGKKSRGGLNAQAIGLDSITIVLFDNVQASHSISLRKGVLPQPENWIHPLSRGVDLLCYFCCGRPAD